MIPGGSVVESVRAQWSARLSFDMYPPPHMYPQVGALWKACVHSRDNVARVLATGAQHVEAELNRPDATVEIKR